MLNNSMKLMLIRSILFYVFFSSVIAENSEIDKKEENPVVIETNISQEKTLWCSLKKKTRTCYNKAVSATGWLYTKAKCILKISYDGIEFFCNKIFNCISYCYQKIKEKKEKYSKKDTPKKNKKLIWFFMGTFFVAFILFFAFVFVIKTN